MPVSKLVTSGSVEDDNDPNSMKSFAVVKAKNIEAAVKIAQSDLFFGKWRNNPCLSDDGNEVIWDSKLEKTEAMKVMVETL